MTQLPKKVHIIGICGVATSALAIAFHKRGVKVTGSDKGFFPPVSTELEKHGVPFYAGWHVDKMIADGVPDVIIVGTASGSQNPETAYAQEHGIRMYSFAEAIGEFFAQKNSIVCVGTWGKTSSSALLSYILEQAGWAPTYMFGGVSLSHDASAKLTDSEWSVFEGDEYKSSPTDPTAKFFYYRPTHLLLTAVSWDHADLYPTEKEYFAAFEKLLSGIPAGGFITACTDHSGVRNILDKFAGRKITYGREGGDADYTYSKVAQSAMGIDLTITTKCVDYQIHCPMLGAYQAENITGCFAVAHSLGIEPAKIIDAINHFEGLKRRLEKRLDGNSSTQSGAGITILDDIAHSPEKAASVLSTLRNIYSGKIIALFEPNIGGRSRESAAKYDGAFVGADTVIIPRLTKLKVADDASDQPMEGAELAETIKKTQPNTIYIDDDAKLIEYLVTNTKKGDVIAFLGSHGFRGMIEETVQKLQVESYK
jgi:UDP-N-acetylmuramate: L-alanyl-gamma-D-glutamyl-meso-diaminopimelate ligase